MIEVWRAFIQQPLENGAQNEGQRTCSQIAPLTQQTLHAVSNHLHILAAEDLAGQDDVNDVIFAEPMEV
jgi:hypothetical protein